MNTVPAVLAVLALIGPAASVQALSVMDHAQPFAAPGGNVDARFQYALEAETTGAIYIKSLPTDDNPARLPSWQVRAVLLHADNVLHEGDVPRDGSLELGTIEPGQYSLSLTIKGSTQGIAPGSDVRFLFALAQHGDCGPGSSGGCYDPSTTLTPTINVVESAKGAPAPALSMLIAGLAAAVLVARRSV